MTAVLLDLDRARERPPPPPHDLAAEAGLLGAMMLSRDAIGAGVETCRVDDFYSPNHGHVFAAVSALYGRGEPADPVTVGAELTRADLLDVVGGLPVLLTLLAGAPATSSAASHGRIVAGHASTRRTMALLEDAQVAVRTGRPVEHIMDRIRSESAEPAPSGFRRWSTAELLAEPDDFGWLVQGLLAEPTYGQIAGEMKTLKTYLAGFIQVGLAAGVPIFGQFKPPTPRPVLGYVGEGGRVPYARRLRRIAAAMGVDLANIPLHVSFDVAPIQSPVFQQSLTRDLADLHPGLVTLDPLYSYHGAQSKASDLHAEGALLNGISKPCGDADASLMVVNHYNQTGTGNGLKRITMAGSGEWSDSWLLVAHRQDPDVNAGQFHLTLQVGSRQWGGTNWDLDLNVGRFDPDTGAHDGDITWDLRQASGTTPKTAGESPKVAAARHAVLEVLADLPWQLTKTEVLDRVGGNKATRDTAFNSLADDDRIEHNLVARNEAGIAKKRPRWGLVTNPPQTDGACSPGGDE